MMGVAGIDVTVNSGTGRSSKECKVSMRESDKNKSETKQPKKDTFDIKADNGVKVQVGESPKGDGIRITVQFDKARK